MARPDPHSVYDDAQPRVRHLDWRLRIDFAARVLHGEATLSLDGNGDDLDLDTRDLTIDSISDGDDRPLTSELGTPHPFLGRRLRVHRGQARQIRLRYRTSPTALALHWFNQSVYSQCQPIQARTLLPLPDSPSARLTVRAQVTAPRAATVLMGGEFVSRHDEDDALATTVYAMEQPIPPYLLALAVGEFVARDLSPRSRVWAAPALLDDAAAALAGIERTLDAAEQLLGRYRWRRCDLWIAPHSFPYGGMENPRLIFLAPSLLTDPQALTAVVAHELAHAWFGNLVGIASVEHFWLNEGLALWAERRLMATLVGAESAADHAAVGRRDLEQALSAFAPQPELTRLHTHLDGLDPDETLSIVPYEKGYLFLCALEAQLGSDGVAQLLRDYLERHADQVVTSAQLAALVAERLPDFDCEQWLNQSGLPANAPPSPTLAIAPDALPPRDAAARWSPWRWRGYLDTLPRPSSLCATLDEWFNLSETTSAELRAAWLPLAVESDHPAALAQVEAALDGQSARGGGRVKLLRPLYLALARNPRTRGSVGGWWRRFRDSYHPIARQQLDRLLRELGIATQDVNPLGLGLRRRP